MNKKPYTKPAIQIVELKSSDLIATSLPGYDGPLGSREREWDDEEW